MGRKIDAGGAEVRVLTTRIIVSDILINMSNMPDWIVSSIFWITTIYLMFQMVKRLATVEEELMDKNYEVKRLRERVDMLDRIVRMQRDELERQQPQAGRDSRETVAAAEEDSLEEGEIRQPPEDPSHRD
jgi:hypothetical protein